MQFHFISLKSKEWSHFWKILDILCQITTKDPLQGIMKIISLLHVPGKLPLVILHIWHCLLESDAVFICMYQHCFCGVDPNRAICLSTCYRDLCLWDKSIPDYLTEMEHHVCGTVNNSNSRNIYCCMEKIILEFLVLKQTMLDNCLTFHYYHCPLITWTLHCAIAVIKDNPEYSRLMIKCNNGSSIYTHLDMSTTYIITQGL